MIVFTCVICTSARGVPGALLYQWPTPWVGNWQPEECPQCGAGVGILPLDEAPAEDRKAALIRIHEGGLDDAFAAEVAS